MVIGYARVSSAGQSLGYSLEAQEEQLKLNGADVVYKEVYSGRSTERPVLKKIIQEKIQPGDTLVITKIDRLARSISDGLKLIDELLSKNIKIHVINMGVLDNTPTGKLIRTVMMAFAEFEINLIRERLAEGKVAAKQNNQQWREGRKPKYSQYLLDSALKLLTVNGGELSYMQVSRKTGISVATLARAQSQTRKAVNYFEQ